MNCVLFARMDQVFSLRKNRTLKRYWKNIVEKWEPCFTFTLTCLCIFAMGLIPKNGAILTSRAYDSVGCNFVQPHL